MAVLTRCCCAVFMVTCVGALIVPQELPTILSVIYSKIPPILKGTDSRLGLGFRLGPHADFQVLLELGPQTYTQPLGPDAQERTRRRQASRPVLRPVEGDANSPGGKWISSWRSGLVNPSMNSVMETAPANEAPPIEDPTQDQSEVVSHLRQLYNKNETAPTQ